VISDDPVRLDHEAI